MWNVIIFLGAWFGLLAGFILIMERNARRRDRAEERQRQAEWDSIPDNRTSL